MSTREQLQAELLVAHEQLNQLREAVQLALRQRGGVIEQLGALGVSNVAMGDWMGMTPQAVGAIRRRYLDMEEWAPHDDPSA